MQLRLSSGKLCIALILFLAGLHLSAQKNKDSLWAAWSNRSKADTIRLNALDHISAIHTGNSDADSLLRTSAMEYAFAKKIGREKFAIRALTRTADAYILKTERVKAHALYEQCLALSRKEHYNDGLSVCFINLGTNYLAWGDYSKAIHFFYEGLKIVEKGSNKIQRSAALCNIAAVYSKMGKPDSGIHMIRQALNISNATKNKQSIASCFRIMYKAYFQKANLDSVLFYLKKVIAIQTSLNDVAIRHTYFDLTALYMKQKNYAAAKDYLDQSLRISQKISDTAMIGRSVAQRAIISHDEGHTDEAISGIKKAFDILRNRYDPQLRLELLTHLAEWQKEKGNYKMALALNEERAILKDSLGGLNSKSSLYLEQLKYNSEKKDILAKAALDKKISLMNAQARQKDLKKNIWLVIISSISLILLLSAGFVYYHFRQKNTISIQKNNILKQQLLVSQMNPHFIFNSLNAIQNFIFKQDSYHAGIYLKQFSELIRTILDFSRKDFISLDEELQFLKNYLELQKLRFENKLNYELVTGPDLDHEMVLVPPMLAQPFIENAIEHGIFHKAGQGFLSIKITLKNNTLLYEIEDNGIGLENSLKRKNALKTNHKSLAIEITRERIEAINHQSRTDFEIEIRDKALFEKEASGVYVKFTTPFLTI